MYALNILKNVVGQSYSKCSSPIVCLVAFVPTKTNCCLIESYLRIRLMIVEAEDTFDDSDSVAFLGVILTFTRPTVLCNVLKAFQQQRHLGHFFRSGGGRCGIKDSSSE